MATTAGSCPICATGKGISTCTGCHEIKYCSAACQKKDWKTHKLLCQNLTGFRPGDRPSLTSYRCIYFPDNEEKPRFLWLTIEEKDGKREETVWLAAKEYINALSPANPIPYTEAQSICETPKYERERDHTIVLTHRPEYRLDGSVPNHSIVTVAGQGMGGCFKGPMSAYSCRSNVWNNGMGTSSNTVDATMADYRHLLDFFEQKSKGDEIKQRLQIPDLMDLEDLARSVKRTYTNNRS